MSKRWTGSGKLRPSAWVDSDFHQAVVGVGSGDFRLEAILACPSIAVKRWMLGWTISIQSVQIWLGPISFAAYLSDS